ncbi:hypothetical protein EYF80_053817 [Liparis tanakae]|uniref:Uncharacterized protein n=1 Tax=Liparis tanakae TaxID=230148 RepID=A0A4Z2F5I0_9TELE|nr:hypothetical protein EYF80_053817 [Liparis tanakae]
MPSSSSSQWIPRWSPAPRDSTCPGSCRRPRQTEPGCPRPSTGLLRSASRRRRISPRFPNFCSAGRTTRLRRHRGRGGTP